MTVIEAIDDTARALKNLAKVLVAVREQTKGMTAAQVVLVEEKKETPAESQKEGKESVSVEDVRAILAEISRSGKTQAVRALLKGFGADKLSDVPPEKYSELLQKAGEL